MNTALVRKRNLERQAAERQAEKQAKLDAWWANFAEQCEKSLARAKAKPAPAAQPSKPRRKLDDSS